MENKIAVIPNELQQMTTNLAVEKKQEILVAVSNVFENVQKLRSQLDTIVVADENDKTSMKLANTVRMAVRADRLVTEKLIDSKRDAVQEKMVDFKTEDALWLKVKQLMQIESKAVEELAKYKETTGERIRLERIATLQAERYNEVCKYTEFHINGLGEMQTEPYNEYLNGLKMSYDAKIKLEQEAEELRLETERKEKLNQERKAKTIRLVEFIENYETVNFGEISDDEFMAIVNAAIAKRTAKEEEESKLKADLAKAEAERINKEKELEAERKKQAEILAKQKADADEKARIEAEKQAKIQAELQAKAEAERKEKEQIEAELKAKKDAEQLAEQQKIEAVAKAKKEAEQLAKAPVKKQLTIWVDSFELPETTIESPMKFDIIDKFDAFKKWAKLEIEKL